MLRTFFLLFRGPQKRHFLLSSIFFSIEHRKINFLHGLRKGPNFSGKKLEVRFFEKKSHQRQIAAYLFFRCDRFWRGELSLTFAVGDATTRVTLCGRILGPSLTIALGKAHYVEGVYVFVLQQIAFIATVCWDSKAVPYHSFRYDPTILKYYTTS